MLETINLAKARELLARAVETQGRDFVYNTTGKDAKCMYRPMTDEDVPYVEDLPEALPAEDPRRITACVVGVALDLAGHTEHHEAEVGAHALDLEITSAARWYFREAQVAQDGGASWGEALDRAEKALDDKSMNFRFQDEL